MLLEFVIDGTFPLVELFDVHKNGESSIYLRQSYRKQTASSAIFNLITFFIKLKGTFNTAKAWQTLGPHSTTVQGNHHTRYYSIPIPSSVQSLWYSDLMTHNAASKGTYIGVPTYVWMLCANISRTVCGHRIYVSSNKLFVTGFRKKTHK